MPFNTNRRALVVRARHFSPFPRYAVSILREKASLDLASSIGLQCSNHWINHFRERNTSLLELFYETYLTSHQQLVLSRVFQAFAHQSAPGSSQRVFLPRLPVTFHQIGKYLQHSALWDCRPKFRITKFNVSSHEMTVSAMAKSWKHRRFSPCR